MSDPFATKGQKVGLKKFPDSPFVKMGGDESKGQVKHVRGLLKDVRESTKYPGQLLYDMRGVDGKRFTLVGNYGINDKLKSEFIGDAFDITFEGMVVTKSKKTAKNFTIVRLPAADIPADLMAAFDSEEASESEEPEAEGADDELPF